MENETKYGGPILGIKNKRHLINLCTVYSVRLPGIQCTMYGYLEYCVKCTVIMSTVYNVRLSGVLCKVYSYLEYSVGLPGSQCTV